jgi:hypothetical protein
MYFFSSSYFSWQFSFFGCAQKLNLSRSATTFSLLSRKKTHSEQSKRRRKIKPIRLQHIFEETRRKEKVKRRQVYEAVKNNKEKKKVLS